MKKGIFRCVDAESEHLWLITVSVSCDAEGNPDTPAVFTSKAGTNFNHKAEWEKRMAAGCVGKSRAQQ